MNRRTFLATSSLALTAAPAHEWGGPVLDIHLHPRDGRSAQDHLDGSGVTKAVLLTNLKDEARAKAEIAAHPKSFVWFAATDPSAPDGLAKLRQAVVDGARGFGEMKHNLAAGGKEMRQVYDLCAELNVPILMHFQEVKGDFNKGWREFDKILKTYKKTTFIGHADFFWANISADVPMDRSYPEGPIKPGGLTDRFLSDYPNLYGDLSANSGNNALSRDPEFARSFLKRHQNKLMFGCDCSCQDGHGTGGTPLLARLKGKCVARDTLQLAKDLTDAKIFRKITWENGIRLLKIPA
ncbi:MAG: amidohydrolase [Bryobacteraceae bacterium]|nr:amidohydrolase [Bryobacteraceae bacterium]